MPLDTVDVASLGDNVRLTVDVDACRFVGTAAQAADHSVTRALKVRPELLRRAHRAHGVLHTSGFREHRGTWRAVDFATTPHVGLCVIEQTGLGVHDVELFFPALATPDQRRSTALTPAESSVLEEALRRAALDEAAPASSARLRTQILLALSSQDARKLLAPCAPDSFSWLLRSLDRSLRSTVLGAPIVYMQAVGQKRVASSTEQISKCMLDLRHIFSDAALAAVRDRVAFE